MDSKSDSWLAGRTKQAYVNSTQVRTGNKQQQQNRNTATLRQMKSMVLCMKKEQVLCFSFAPRAEI